MIVQMMFGKEPFKVQEEVKVTWCQVKAVKAVADLYPSKLYLTLSVQHSHHSPRMIDESVPHHICFSFFTEHSYPVSNHGITHSFVTIHFKHLTINFTSVLNCYNINKINYRPNFS